MIRNCKLNIREIPDPELERRKLALHIPGQKVIIQTCRRLEVYYGDGSIPETTARDLFRLVSGLDSPFLGDTAIKNQVKRAYQEASRAGLSKTMHRLFQAALHTGKTVQSCTGISIGAVSYPQAVIEWVKKHHPDFQNLTITVVGINNITIKILEWLKSSMVKDLRLINRTVSKAEYYGNRMGIPVFGLDQIGEVASISDILIICVSGNEYFISGNNIPMDKRLTLIDLSSPSVVEPAVMNMAGIRHCSLDDLENNILQNLDNRQEHIETARHIIDYKVDRLMEWQFQNGVMEPALI
jgi:glutamyl-tRNA reductase